MGDPRRTKRYARVHALAVGESLVVSSKQFQRANIHAVLRHQGKKARVSYDCQAKTLTIKRTA